MPRRRRPTLNAYRDQALPSAQVTSQLPMLPSRNQGRGARAASAVAEAAQQVFAEMMRQGIATQRDERVLQRQLAVDAAQARTQAIATAQTNVASGAWTPEQAQAYLVNQGVADSGGQILGRMQSVQPPLQRRPLMTQAAKDVQGATDPEMVPGVAGIFSAADASGAPNVGGLMDLAARSEGRLSLEQLLPEAPLSVQQLAQQAQVRRRELADRPEVPYTEVLSTGEVRSGYRPKRAPAVTTQLPAVQQGMLEGQKKRAELQYGPTPEMLGEFEGQKEVSTLNVAGRARADQARVESAARARGELEPDIVAKRIAQSGGTAEATRKGQIRAETAMAREILDLEMKKQLQQLELLPREVATREWAKDIYDTGKASDEGLMVVGELRRLYDRAKHSMPGVGMPFDTLLAQVQQGLRPRSALPSEVREYMDFAEAAKPRLARIMGQVGQLTEAEQVRAGLTAPDFVDAAAGQGDTKIDRLEAFFTVGPSLAQMRQPGSAQPVGDQRTQEIARRIEMMMQLLRSRRLKQQGRGAGVDLRLTPRGIIRP